ncbi:uncharacterized protein LOC118202863 [Stegodyphus dumicola]|uniref:uncharacterized protein LOC118202863 n=1 Tax=Stegodyphus dumicola TaxID=202533 RepID=UPI0015ADDB5A|nr:uncharacterized protein LOC118202863 [Stegodyphus dumicola]
MWIFIVSAFVIASAALEEDDYCKKSAYRTCEVDKTSGLPGNEKEFDERCPALLDQFRCNQEHASKCHPESVQWYTTRYELLQDLCRKDSHLHEAIVKNIGCIKENVTEECSEKIIAVVLAYIDFLDKTGDEDSAEEDFRKFSCMNEAYTVTCAADSASRQCGSIVKTSILEMARRVDFLDKTEACPRQVRQAMVKDIPSMEISMAQKLLLEEVLLES